MVSLSCGSGQEIRLSINDTGIGLAPEELPRIFERFYRGDQSRSRPGSGLGLSLARSIARVHGGDILVSSTPGAGSTFTVVLPSSAPENSGPAPAGDSL